MRAAVAALALGLLLVAAGCGNGSAAVATSSTDAASFVPASALAYVSADSNLDSSSWQLIRDVFGPLDLGSTSQSDLSAALGDRVNLAVLGIDNGKPEAVALVHPSDEAKLSEFAKKFDSGDEHYTVQKIGGWSVVADSAAAFQSVRDAGSGSSLADNAAFKSALAQVGDSGFATAYVAGSAVQQLPAKLQSLVRVAGSPQWLAARVDAANHELRLRARVAGGSGVPAAYKPTLLQDVPSGAIAAVSFKNLNQLLARMKSEPSVRALLPSYLDSVSSLGGEGVLYLLPGTLLPVVTLELRANKPDAAAKAFSGLAAKAAKLLPLRVERHGSKVVLTNAAAGTRQGSGSLTQDQPFKDALAAADVPNEVTWLAYADMQRLAPILQALASLQGNGQSKTPDTTKLDKFDTLVAFGARSGSTSRLELTLTTR